MVIHNTHKISCLLELKEATNTPWLGLNQANNNSWLQEAILVLLTKVMPGSTHQALSEEACSVVHHRRWVHLSFLEPLEEAVQDAMIQVLPCPLHHILQYILQDDS